MLFKILQTYPIFRFSLNTAVLERRAGSFDDPNQLFSDDENSARLKIKNINNTHVLCEKFVGKRPKYILEIIIFNRRV